MYIIAVWGSSPARDNNFFSLYEAPDQLLGWAGQSVNLTFFEDDLKTASPEGFTDWRKTTVQAGYTRLISSI
jgi:hypothetical protein